MGTENYVPSRGIRIAAGRHEPSCLIHSYKLLICLQICKFLRQSPPASTCATVSRESWNSPSCLTPSFVEEAHAVSHRCYPYLRTGVTYLPGSYTPYKGEARRNLSDPVPTKERDRPATCQGAAILKEDRFSKHCSIGSVLLRSIQKHKDVG